MLIEASKGGHIGVVQLLLDYPNSIGQQQNVQNQSQPLIQNSQLQINSQQQILNQQLPEIQSQQQQPQQQQIIQQQLPEIQSQNLQATSVSKL